MKLLGLDCEEYMGFSRELCNFRIEGMWKDSR